MNCTSCGEQISEKAEICPKCGVRPFRENNYCSGCGATLKPNQEMCVQCGRTVARQHNDMAMKSGTGGSGLEPGIAALLSFLLTGLSQMIMGQGKKGATMLIGSMILAVMTASASAFITIPLSAIDAYLIAKKKKAGVPVRDWEFF